MKLLLILALLILFSPRTSTSVIASKGYTNAYGCEADLQLINDLSCHAGELCNLDQQYCIGQHILVHQCSGKQLLCLEGEQQFAEYFQLPTMACDYTVQLSVFEQTCLQDDEWICQEDDLTDYFVYYTGQCEEDQTNLDSHSDDSCQNLEIVAGNNSLVPVTVTFKIEVADNQNIEMYRIYFGDGNYYSQKSNLFTHQYESSGHFLVIAEYQNEYGQWIGSQNCQKNVRVKSSPIESHKSACSDLHIQADNSAQAPSNVIFIITGYDNKGEVQRYRLSLPDGSIKESQSNSFTHTFDKPGTYQIDAFIQDSEGQWQGGSGNCQKNVYIHTKNFDKQPDTGTPTIFGILATSSGLFGLILKIKDRSR